MEKLEKVIKGLGCCDNDDCDNCPYFYSDDENDLGTCKATLHRDALALLKAQERDMADMREDLQDTLKENMRMAELLKPQEPVKPVFDAGDGKTIGQFLCGKCHAKIGFGHPHFCWYCGRAVKWSE